MIKAEGAWAPRLRMGLLQAVQGLKIGLWVPGAVGRDRDGHWSLGSPEQSHLGKVAWSLPGSSVLVTGWDAQEARLDRAPLGWLGGGGRPEALIPCQPACRVLSARLSMGPPSESYCSAITRTIIICADICRDKRGHGIQTHVCNAVSVVLCLVVMCYICMSTQCTACPGILNPEMEVQIDITARQHRPSCPSYQHQVGYCGIKLTRRVQAGKRGEVFASFLLVSPAPSCFACLLLFLLTVRVHPGMRIPARVFLNACLPARQPARQPAPASLTDGPACQQAYPTCSSPWTSVYPAKTKK